jgi:GxxExxY protein
MLRVQSPLSDEVERLIHDVIGCCIAVHRSLGPGLREKVYTRAVAIELNVAGIPFERERRYPIRHRGHLLSELVVDFVVGKEIVLELKSIERLAPVHHAQILNYMRIANLHAGLLVNFNVAILPDGLSRKVL